MNPGFFKRHVDARRQAIQTRIALEAEETQRIEKLQARAEEENKKVRRLVADRRSDLPEQTPLINIPSGLSELSIPSEARIAKYKAHLRKNIRDAAQYSDASELTDCIQNRIRTRCLAKERELEGNSDLRIISDRLCAICKGGCCAVGKDHAFNTVSTMRRFMDDNPTMTEEEILDAYLERIDAKTIEGSCINQTKQGCGLPREMRSDTCNGFYCDEIKNYHLDFSDTKRDVSELIAVQRAPTLSDHLAPEADHGIVSVNLVSVQNVEQIELAGHNQPR